MSHNKIDLYLNLHKSSGDTRVYSLRSREKADRGKVFKYTSYCLLGSSTFHVSQTGQKKVQEFKRKLVHAVIRSDNLISCDKSTVMAFLEQHQKSVQYIGYCPYQTKSFCLLDAPKVSKSKSHTAITTATFIIVLEDRIFAIT